MWSLLWVVVLISLYLLHFSRIGPAKDLCIVLGVVSQLMACWKLGGSDMHYGWRWVKLIILWIFFTVPIQDFRDVPGDLAAGRRTTPILLGDIPGMCAHVSFENISSFCSDLHILNNSSDLYVLGTCFDGGKISQYDVHQLLLLLSQS